MNDLPANMRDRIRTAFENLRGILDDCDKLLSRSRIFVDRMEGVGTISAKDAISWGITGPLLYQVDPAPDAKNFGNRPVTAFTAGALIIYFTTTMSKPLKPSKPSARGF